VSRHNCCCCWYCSVWVNFTHTKKWPLGEVHTHKEWPAQDESACGMLPAMLGSPHRVPSAQHNTTNPAGADAPPLLQSATSSKLPVCHQRPAAAAAPDTSHSPCDCCQPPPQLNYWCCLFDQHCIVTQPQPLLVPLADHRHPQLLVRCAACWDLTVTSSSTSCC
jgi:hypothetical protein